MANGLFKNDPTVAPGFAQQGPGTADIMSLVSGGQAQPASGGGIMNQVVSPTPVTPQAVPSAVSAPVRQLSLDQTKGLRKQ